MHYFMLKDAGIEWIFKAENEKEATKAFLSKLGFKDKYAYQNYCDFCQDNGVDNQIEWEECVAQGNNT